MLIMKIGPLPDALEPGFHCVRTQWIRGFIAFQLARRARTVVLMVPAWPESGFRVPAPQPRPLADREDGAGGAHVTGLLSRWRDAPAGDGTYG
jgi:hypothetical protein